MAMTHTFISKIYSQLNLSLLHSFRTRSNWRFFRHHLAQGGSFKNKFLFGVFYRIMFLLVIIYCSGDFSKINDNSEWVVAALMKTLIIYFAL